MLFFGADEVGLSDPSVTTYGCDIFHSVNRHPFVVCDDISPNRGVTFQGRQELSRGGSRADDNLKLEVNPLPLSLREVSAKPTEGVTPN